MFYQIQGFRRHGALYIISLFIMLSGLQVAAGQQLPSVAGRPEWVPLDFFYEQEKAPGPPHLVKISSRMLPPPYDRLLTQPLMTIAMSNYFQRTPKIKKPIYVRQDHKKNTYSRAILMIIDKNKKRDDALKAELIGESQIVELGLITINLSALPAVIIDELSNTHVPFGALLVKNKIKTSDVNKQFFYLTCDKTIAKYLSCQIGEKRYGRTNTLVRQDNQQWVARVVEIL